MLGGIVRADAPTEDDYYRIVTIPVPQNISLEVGGIAALDDGRVLVCTRRGEIWLVTDTYADDPAKASFKLWARGLAEPLGLLSLDGWIYAVQRGELTRLKDTDGDDRADLFETVCNDWQVSGNYHEFAFGPRLDKEGKLWVTLNKPFGGENFGTAKWRGWAVRVDPTTGAMQPMCVGLRSPAGLEISPDGVVFYSDNQGEWCNASKISVLEHGRFYGHPWGLEHTPRDQAPFKDIAIPPSGELMMDVTQHVPQFKMPAVFLPYGKMGQSPAGMVFDTTGGKFGPFEGQMFIGDQHHSNVMRVCLEKVDGHWQGAAFRFRDGFECGVTRVSMGPDASMLVGMTNRGWGSLGNKPYGLQRLVWTGKTPFEIRTMRVKPDGFELTFTEPVDRAAAGDVKSYEMSSYTYRLRSAYGGPEELTESLPIRSAAVSDDGRTVRLVVDNLRRGFVHELHAVGVRNAAGRPLLHATGYYTLVNLPAK
jgi:glucose/arabinose dehydrogenase